MKKATLFADYILSSHLGLPDDVVQRIWNGGVTIDECTWSSCLSAVVNFFDLAKDQAIIDYCSGRGGILTIDSTSGQTLSVRNVLAALAAFYQDEETEPVDQNK